MADPYLNFRDLYHALDESKALESIDNLIGGLPLIGFQNLGSTLFAEDRGLPSWFHTAPEFIIRAGRRGPRYVEQGDSPRPRSSRPPARIDDHLVTQMKTPVDLPSQSARAPEPLSHGYNYGPALPAQTQPSGHRRHASATSITEVRPGLPPYHSAPQAYAGHPSGYSARPPAEDYSNDPGRHRSSRGHAKRPSEQYQLPPSLPSVSYAHRR
ncbi:hypothetical protein D9615_001972 [Tricholomella constricta]|uniref:Uncharacterized protein n=1 Tax=Tricholomella constricta TaxID=117010 RepID=A0A8H5MAB7_9AGAR|nr:hypothetical protein D9615_001972 [Tricholomella constricta]